MEIAKLRQDFQRFYAREPRIFRAPARVNLIGEHTDYNEGFVLPAAIDFYTCAAIATRQDSQVTLRSQSFEGTVSVDLRHDLMPRHDWSDYPVGVLEQIKRSGQPIKGADILIGSNVPIGAGLSSSAAIEVALGIAVLTSNNLPFDRVQLALLCQRAENEFVGMRCGIMDQFISCHGKRDHALMLDCRNLDFNLLPVSPKAKLVICNTMVKHQLASGEYNRRRAACEEGVLLLRQKLPAIRSLRDVSAQDLEHHRGTLPELIYRRCRHVVTENTRVEAAAEMLARDDLYGFGRLMAESHESLRDDYEVSCRELDVMVNLAGKQRGVFGARMTGGGFGGCTVNLVSVDHAESFKQEVAITYEQAFGLRPEIYISSAADGAGTAESV
jgi:galactokinase